MGEIIVMKKLILLTFAFMMIMAYPVKANTYTQEEIDQINAKRIEAAQAEVERVQKAAAIKAQNELEAAQATAEAFAEDVERRKEAYEDWVDDQRRLAGEIVEDDEDKTEIVIEKISADEEFVILDAELDTEIEVKDDEIVSTENAEEVDLTAIEETATKIVETEIIENANVEANDESIIETAVNNTYGISAEDYDNLCRIVEAEAANSGMKGKIMVANVVLNRVQSPQFANTITTVIKSKGQFTPAINGKMYRVNVSNETVEAVNRALAGENYAENALYFKSAVRGNYFRGKKAIASVGGNNFFG